MAHSIEARVPFLDVSMIALAQRIGADLKLRRQAHGSRIEKWILRKACQDLLPEEILWRDKEQFDEGSGTADLIAGQKLTDWLPADAAEAYSARYHRAALRSHEECVYHRILKEVYPDDEFIFDNVARWSERPPKADGPG
jgi:asparagine synthase (glutamine-hydrolysing)